MPGVRELLAVVLGILLGVVLITVPQTALRLSVFVGPNRRRRGDYGTDNHDLLSDQWTLLIQFEENTRVFSRGMNPTTSLQSRWLDGIFHHSQTPNVNTE